MRSEQEIVDAMNKHGDTVWRVCVMHIKDTADAEDAFQETFIKYSTSETKEFESDEHRKAWLIRVASNSCKDMLRSTKRRAVPIGGEAELSVIRVDDDLRGSQPAEHRAEEIIDAVRRLADPPRTPVYLFLYEGYSASEIATILDAPVNTVYSWVSRGKKMLREVLA